MPTTQFAFKEKYRYQNGFNSYHEYEIQTSQLYIALTSRQK
jgi:homogentisate 1,2-dioxygenase